MSRLSNSTYFSTVIAKGGGGRVEVQNENPISFSFIVPNFNAYTLIETKKTWDNIIVLAWDF